MAIGALVGAGAAAGSAGAGGATAAAGAGLGPVGWAGLAALSAAPLIAGLFGKKRGSSVDISGELANIRAQIAKAREAATANINRHAALGRRSAADNLATRGVYRSPVAENTFGRLEVGRLAAIGEAEGQLAGQQAGLESQLLSALLGYKIQDERSASEANAGRVGAGASLLAQLLMAGLGSGGFGQPGGGSGGDFMRQLQTPAWRTRPLSGYGVLR